MTNPLLVSCSSSFVCSQLPSSPHLTYVPLSSPFPLFSPFLFSTYFPPLLCLCFPTARFLFFFSLDSSFSISSLLLFSFSCSFYCLLSIHVFLSISSHLSVFTNCLLFLPCCLLSSSGTLCISFRFSIGFVSQPGLMDSQVTYFASIVASRFRMRGGDGHRKQTKREEIEVPQ